MWTSLDQKLERYQELERQMADPAVIAVPLQFTRAVKEHGRLARLVKPYQNLQKLEDEVGQAKSLLDTERDADLRHLAEEEVSGLQSRRDVLRQQLEDMLLESSEENFDSIIVEIRAGTGGDEAALFAGDLYGMYARYARERGWAVEDI